MSDTNKPPADQPVIQNPRTITKPRHTIAAALLAIDLHGNDAGHRGTLPRCSVTAMMSSTKAKHRSQPQLWAGEIIERRPSLRGIFFVPTARQSRFGQACSITVHCPYCGRKHVYG